MRKLPRVAALVFAGVLVLTGCGGGADDADVDVAPDSSADETSTTESTGGKDSQFSTELTPPDVELEVTDAPGSWALSPDGTQAVKSDATFGSSLSLTVFSTADGSVSGEIDKPDITNDAGVLAGWIDDGLVINASEQIMFMSPTGEVTRTIAADCTVEAFSGNWAVATALVPVCAVNLDTEELVVDEGALGTMEGLSFLTDGLDGQVLWVKSRDISAYEFDPATLTKSDQELDIAALAGVIPASGGSVPGQLWAVSADRSTWAFAVYEERIEGTSLVVTVIRDGEQIARVHARGPILFTPDGSTMLAQYAPDFDGSPSQVGIWNF